MFVGLQRIILVKLQWVNPVPFQKLVLAASQQLGLVGMP